jgi:hypothetical protein
MTWGIVILFRLLVPLVIFRWPLAGTILAIIADNLDVVLLDLFGVTDFTPYNHVDKLLDTYFYLIGGYTMYYWKNTVAKKIGLSLLLYRLIGVVLYEISGLRILLFLFPNVFIFYFLYYLIYKKIYKKEPFKLFRGALPVLIILLIIKLLHEYMLHVVQFPIYKVISESIFTVFR